MLLSLVALSGPPKYPELLPFATNNRYKCSHYGYLGGLGKVSNNQQTQSALASRSEELGLNKSKCGALGSGIYKVLGGFMV